MITKKSIMEAWTFLREKNCTIPDETLDFMRDVSLKILDQEYAENIRKTNIATQLLHIKASRPDIDNIKYFIKVMDRPSCDQSIEMLNYIDKLEQFINEHFK